MSGVLRLRDLLLSASNERINRLAISDPLSVRDTASLDDLVEIFEGHLYLGVPVVDQQRHLLGVVHRSAVGEAENSRTTSDFLILGTATLLLSKLAV